MSATTTTEGLPNCAKLRKLRGMSQAQLGEALGVAKRSVIRWEMGDSDPVLGDVRRIASYFGVTVAYLIGEVNEFGQAEPSRSHDR